MIAVVETLRRWVAEAVGVTFILVVVVPEVEGIAPSAVVAT